MKIRSKLAWTFILLQVFGVTAVSSYSIMYIRAFLLEEGVQQMEDDAHWMVQTLQNVPEGEGFDAQVSGISAASRYDLQLYDRQGRHLVSARGAPGGMDRPAADVKAGEQQLAEGPAAEAQVARAAPLPDTLTHRLSGPQQELHVDERTGEGRIYVYAHMPETANPAHFVRMGLNRDRLFEPVAAVRWIIYSGMFISIGLIVLVSTWFARSLSRPIIELTGTAQRIADGDVDQQIHLNRKDEFGDLSDSLNRMASRLRADNERLKQINEQQRRFFADITHEMRNPLHTIMGSAQMLQMKHIDDEKRRRHATFVYNQADRMNRLFRDLRTLQTHDEHTDFLEQRPFDLSEVTGRLAELYRDKAREQGIAFHMDRHPCRVFGDAAKIEQVLDNLLSNALKYTAEGEVRLTYRLEGDEVDVQVCDTGPGISEEHLPRLFDRFYRTDKARSRDQGGTGLGLAVVKRILEAHGTHIHVDSDPGKGSCFQFKLSGSS